MCEWKGVPLGLVNKKSDFTYLSDMSLEDYCIQMKKPKPLRLGTQVSTTLPYMEMHRDFGNSL